jgi:serine/threonine-protein kinase/endoribonuclease IRE1
MPPREEVLYQLATGLEYIHEKGMVHRDIKPQNVLIWVNPEKEEQVLMKWADFGLSKKVNENGSFSISGVRGTDNWLAPELLKLLKEEELTDGLEGSTLSSRQRGTVKSDVFAEGLVFGYFYLDGEHIFGKIPVNIHSQTDINNNILKNNPVNISSKLLQLKSKAVQSLF